MGTCRGGYGGVMLFLRGRKGSLGSLGEGLVAPMGLGVRGGGVLMVIRGGQVVLKGWGRVLMGFGGSCCPYGVWEGGGHIGKGWGRVPMGLGECPCQRAGGGGPVVTVGVWEWGGPCGNSFGGWGGRRSPWEFIGGGVVTSYLWFGKMPLWELGGQGVCGHVLRSHCLQGNWGGWGGLIVPPSG